MTREPVERLMLLKALERNQEIPEVARKEETLEDNVVAFVYGLVLAVLMGVLGGVAGGMILAGLW